MKIKRLIWRVVFIVLIACVAGILSVNYYANWRLRHEIALLSSQKIKGLYSLHIGSTQLNIWSGTLKASDVVISTDIIAWAGIRQAWPDSFPPVVEMSVHAIDILHFSWASYFSRRNIDFKALIVDQPVLHLMLQGDTIQQDSMVQRQFRALKHLLFPMVKALIINNFAIKNANITFNTLLKGDTLMRHCTGLNLSFKALNIDEQSTETTFCRDIALQAGHGEFHSHLGTHSLAFDHLKFSKAARIISLGQCSVVPKQDEQAFFSQLHFRKDYLSFACPEITIKGFDLDKLLKNNYFYADSLLAKEATLAATVNHFLPLPYRKILPHELVQKITSLFNIGNIVFKDSEISLTTRLPGADYLLTFNHCYINADNLSNDSTLMNSEHPLQIWAEAQFMNHAPLKIKLSLPLLSQSFNGDYTVSIQHLPMAAFNPIISHNNVSIKSGFLQMADISATIQQGVSLGTIKMQYHNLDVQILHKGSGKPRIVMSELVDLFVKEDNIRDTDPSTPFIIGKIYHIRNRQEGFFMFLWRSLQSGMLPSIVPSHKKLKKVMQ